MSEETAKSDRFENAIEAQDIEAVEWNFTYHAPATEDIAKYQEIREAAKALSLRLVKLCPRTPERTLALRAIENGVMWANAAIARQRN